MYGGDEVAALVLDIGSYLTKAGYAGDDSPRVVIPSMVGTINDPNSMELETPLTYAGDKMLMRRDYMRVEPALVPPEYKWPLIECLIAESIGNELKLDSKEHPILLSEPSMHDRETRIKMTEILFEKFQVPALYIVKSAVLSSFASGRSTSLVLDSGGSITSAVPVHDGYVLQKSIVRFPIGGEYITDLLLKQLMGQVTIRPSYSFTKHMKSCYVEGGEIQGNIELTIEEKSFPNTDPTYHEFAIREIVKDIKESTFKVSDSPFSDSAFSNVPCVNYELPDGSVVEIGNERFKYPEIFFSGVEGMVGFTGIHQMVYDSITRCDMDIRRELYGNLVVTGGNSLFSGFTDRLQKKLTELTTQNMKVKLIAPQSSIERRFSSWIGGSILACLGSFQQMWMSRQEYDEHGAILVERKCP
ncbi:hypothetical protein SteCoe_27760 [Stentor coeruleus]|uniref:Actin, cytoplasmic n=1 Tax=Stentor coeruleus TaxID=5963 RepID=A0A1R2B9U8_9CILI|nr:hypothetical protein SteCoe_27760 [Stentor coeruleus]